MDDILSREDRLASFERAARLSTGTLGTIRVIIALTTRQESANRKATVKEKSTAKEATSGARSSSNI